MITTINYEKCPIEMFYTVFDKSQKGVELTDEEFYEIQRFKGHITLSLLQSKLFHLHLEKVFSSKCSYRYLRHLDELEILEKVFPSIHALKGIDGGHYHNETVFTHVMNSLRALEKLDLPWLVKLSALYHDCGKQKYEDFDDGRRRFNNHAAFGTQLVECDLRRLKFPEGIIDTPKTLVSVHMQQVDGKKSIFKLKRILDEHKIPFKYFMWVRYADNKGSIKCKTNFMFYWSLYKKCLQTLYPKHEPAISDLKINGHDLMSMFDRKPGPWLGKILQGLFEGWQRGHVKNEKEDLCDFAKELYLFYEVD